ncbi:helix-turn-helix domain-containing protein [Rhodococcus xishaensis]|uniref:DNA-binding protein n=1 Tax=Rhodococcus xishaensis TaxID=2487364 RepID=A0A438ARI8_9NOCA|nr:helix-turn-helix domain-containing protein [Rhodococcus xishaensis]RVW01316.1 DNA-binding protein [Rhodococcus xishaensis]
MSNPTGASLHRLESAAQRLGVGRSTLYGLMNSGQLRSVKIGKSRLIPESAICELVAKLESEAADE